MFVAMAENPEALSENFPDLYRVIIRTYPQIAQGMPRDEP
jgi:hypothetical protein